MSLALSNFAGSVAAQPAADTVFKSGAVYTVDAARRWAEAVAVRGERIVYVGTDEGVRSFTGPQTRVIDLGGKMLLPAFQDVHVHPASSALAHLDCSLYGAADLQEYLETVSRCAKERPEGSWVRGGGWSLDEVPNGLPDKRWLDEVAADKPVALESADGHSLWVNSRALELAGITAETKDPEGGRIDRYPDTLEPSGSLQESAMRLVEAVQPAYTHEERLEAARFAVKLLNDYGITTVQDAIVKVTGTDPYRLLEVYRDLDKAGELSLRVVAALWWEPSMGVEEQIESLTAARKAFTKGNMYATAVKIMQDGVIETHTAALIEPYSDRPGDRGPVFLEPEKLNPIVALLDSHGFQVHFHAIGDRATRDCLNAVQHAREKNGPRDARHHISHLQLIHPEDIPRFRELQVIANFQPLWAIADKYVTELALPRTGPERGRWMYPIKSVLDTGAIVAFGSDWSVSSANPLEQIETAVTRLEAHGNTSVVFLPEERISLADAIAAFTIKAAYTNFLDRELGSIEVGKLADLVVLDRNLFEIAPDRISGVKVERVMMAGKLL